jgi:hypothetical protein
MKNADRNAVLISSIAIFSGDYFKLAPSLNSVLSAADFVDVSLLSASFP